MKRQYIYTYTGRAQIKCLAIFKDTRIGTIQTAIQQNLITNENPSLQHLAIGTFIISTLSKVF